MSGASSSSRRGDNNDKMGSGDSDPSHIDIRRSTVKSLVRFECYEKDPENPRKLRLSRAVSGTVILAKERFCYILLAVSAVVLRSYEIFKVQFPGSNVSSELTKAQLHVNETRLHSATKISGIFVPRNLVEYSLSEVAGVDFAQNEVSRNEVHLHAVHPSGVLLTSGLVSSTTADVFHHSAAARGYSSAFGGRVFNGSAELVGICYGTEGVLFALNVRTLKSALQDSFFEKSTSFDDFLGKVERYGRHFPSPK